MSFSIPTLRAYRITTGGVTPAAPTFSVGVSCNGPFSVLNGFFSTATAGSSLVYTVDGTTPVYGSNGTTIPCVTGYFVTTTPTSCEQQNIGVAICPSGTTTIKAIAYLSGQSSSVASTTACRTCPGSLTAPTITSTCPLGQGAFGCNGGRISFTISGAGGGCSVLRYTIAEGSPPPDPTISSNSATAGASVIYQGTTVGNGIGVFIKAAFFDPSCGLSSSVTSTNYGYQYP